MSESLGIQSLNTYNNIIKSDNNSQHNQPQQQRVKCIDKLVNDLTNALNDTYYLFKTKNNNLTDYKETSSNRNRQNRSKTLKRKIKRRRSTHTAGHLTDASESSFDSSLIDCFKSFATLNESNVMDIGLRRRKNIQRFRQNRHQTNQFKTVKRLNTNKRLSKRELLKIYSNKNSNNDLKTQNSSSTSKFIENSDSKGTKRKCSNFIMNSMDIDKNPSMNTDKMSTTNANYSSDDIDDDDKESRLTETDDIEADDEQSDWPVNEPSVLHNLWTSTQKDFNSKSKCDQNINKRTNDDTDDTDIDENSEEIKLKHLNKIFENTFPSFIQNSSCEHFHTRVRNIMDRQFRRAKRRCI